VVSALFGRRVGQDEKLRKHTRNCCATLRTYEPGNSHGRVIEMELRILFSADATITLASPLEPKKAVLRFCSCQNETVQLLDLGHLYRYTALDLRSALALGARLSMVPTLQELEKRMRATVLRGSCVSH
jgi:hypothetical protein